MFVQRRKTEPNLIFILRICFMALALIFFVSYIIFLILDLIHDKPVIQLSFKEVDEIPIPGM